MCTALAAQVGLSPAAEAVLRWLDGRLEARGGTARTRDMAASAERWARRFTELARFAAVPAPALGFGADAADGRPAMLARDGLNAAVIRPGPDEAATAGDIMIALSSVPVCSPDTTVRDALGQMLASGEQTLPVLDEAEVVIGVVTIASLARAVVQTRGLPSIQLVETLLQPYTAVTADTPAAAAARRQTRS